MAYDPRSEWTREETAESLLVWCESGCGDIQFADVTPDGEWYQVSCWACQSRRWVTSALMARFRDEARSLALDYFGVLDRVEVIQ